MPMLKGSCQCGTSHLTLSTAPRQRMFCHCRICQSVYGLPYSDFTVNRTRNVESLTRETLEFKKHRKHFSFSRGTCRECGQPVVAFLDYLPGISLALIPSRVLEGVEDRLTPIQHLYYNRRVDDVHDDLPKVSGGIRSTLACVGPFLKVAMGR